MNFIAKVTSWIDIVKQLPFDGGASVTRWVFVRTAEVIALGWFLLTVGAIYEYIRFGKADVVYCGMILTLGGGLFAFAQNAQVTKLSIDSKGASESSTIKTGLVSSEVTTGVSGNDERA